MKRFILPALVLIIMIPVISCTKSSTSDPGTNEVWMQDMAFTPSVITVAPGTTITWTNKDGVAHNVTSDTGLFSSGSMANGDTFSYKFTTAGTFSYKCTIHPSMTASVKVN